MAQQEVRGLKRYEPRALRPMSFFDEMEREFEDFFRRPLSMISPTIWPTTRTAPGIASLVDIFEDNGNVVVKAELPGITKDDLDLKIADDILTISGEKKKEEKVEEKDYCRMERSFGSFTRSFSLPATVQTDKIKAHFKDGVLEIILPKTEDAKRKERQIKIE